MAADQVDDWLRQLHVDRRDACLLAILHEGGSQVDCALYQNGMVAPLTLAYNSLQNRYNRRLHDRDNLSAAEVSSQVQPGLLGTCSAIPCISCIACLLMS